METLIPPHGDAKIADSITPIQVIKSDGNLTLAAVTGVWTDVDPGGSAAARPLDIVIPNVKAGQWVYVEMNALSGAAATGVPLDMFTVVGGVSINGFSGNDLGQVGWFLPNSTVGMSVTGGRSYQLLEEDIENGSVRLRLRHRNLSGATTRTISASAANGPFVLEGRGPLGQGV
jgi:hypothetical protein